MVIIRGMQKSNNEAPAISLLPALGALLETRSVTRAALQIGISQPAMSRIFAKLRVIYNDPLIVRTGARSNLTPRAEALRAPVAAILKQVSQLTTGPRFDPGTAQQRFVIAVPDTVAAILLPPLRAAFQTSAPNCQIALAPWPGKNAMTADFDLAIATDPDIFPGYRMERLYQDHDVLAYRARDIPPSGSPDLRRAHVAVVPAGLTQDLVDTWMASHSVSRTIAISVPHYLQALNLVANSDLVAILPCRLVMGVGALLGVASVELQLPQTPDTYWMLHPAHLSADAANLWLQQSVRDVFA
jgi:DNA-binding transcriptional LysR family regulator